MKPNTLILTDMNNEIYFLAEKAVELLKKEKMTVATAESCTGGLLSAYITAVPGSSQVFEMGLASYSSRIKNEALGVKSSTLREHGAVSHKTAREMAENIRRKASADIGLSVTGVAGPDSSEDHPPGQVYIAAAHKRETKVYKYRFEPKSRDYIREEAVKRLLELLIKTTEKEMH